MGILFKSYLQYCGCGLIGLFILIQYGAIDLQSFLIGLVIGGGVIGFLPSFGVSSMKSKSNFGEEAGEDYDWANKVKSNQKRPISKQLSAMYDSDMPQRVLLNLKWEGEYWMNFGYWVKDSPGRVVNQVDAQGNSSTKRRVKVTDFVEAASGLARKLAQAVGLSKDDILLDVGVGCGDQDFFYAKQFGTSRIVGIDIVAKQIAVANARLEQKFSNKEGRCDKEEQDSTRFLSGLSFETRDAMDLPESFKNSFTKVLCLDSAYHFSSRRGFLRGANECLKPHGKIGLVDICLLSPFSAYSLMERFCLRVVSVLFHIPIENMCTREEYCLALVQEGFVDVGCENISDELILGFGEFVDRHSGVLESLTQRNPWIGLKIASFLLRLSHRRKVFGFFVFNAEKR
eukprot:Nk52_evm26s243 gene=Nk52_evmTU26s243